MASTYSSDLKIELMATGENAGTWGDKTNTNLNLVQQAIAGYQEIDVASADVTLVMSNAAISNARNMSLKFTGTLAANRTVNMPASIEKFFNVIDGTDHAGFTLTFKVTSQTGFLLCDGSAVSRSTYATLFAALDNGNIYGAGDGSSTFNLPDLRGRVIAGQDDMGGASANRLTDQTGGLNGDTLGGTGGSETHTLTTAQLASHTHTFSDTDSHTVSFPRTLIPGAANNSVNVDGSGQRHDEGTLTVSISGTTSSAGSVSAHNNVQPTIILNYIIKT